MFVQESVLFKDLGPEFMGEISEAAHEENYAQDQMLFQRGEPADYLYLLDEGRISLFIEEGGVLNFSVDTPGEVFGWSALVEPHIYTATARCDAGTRVVIISRTALEHVFQKNPREAFQVMKRLAGAIGQRLTRCYEAHLLSRADLGTPSYG